MLLIRTRLISLPSITRKGANISSKYNQQKKHPNYINSIPLLSKWRAWLCTTFSKAI